MPEDLLHAFGFPVSPLFDTLPVERGPIDPLGEELIRVIREIQLGKTRRHALRDLAHRVDLPDLRSVVNALVQADEMALTGLKDVGVVPDVAISAVEVHSAVEIRGPEGRVRVDKAIAGGLWVADKEAVAH